MNKARYSMVWKLDTLFTESSQLQNHIKQLKIKIDDFEEELNDFGILQENEVHKLESALKYIGDIRVNLSEVNSFITCLLSQNPKNQNAMNLREKTSSISARFDSSIKKFQRVLLTPNQHAWETTLETEELKNYRYILNEWRKNADMLLSTEEEKIISDLMVDGYHAWGQFYNSILSSIKVKILIEEETKEFSVGQAINLRSHPNENVRKTAHLALENIWKEKRRTICTNIKSYRRLSNTGLPKQGAK